MQRLTASAEKWQYFISSSDSSKTTGAWTLPAYCPLTIFHLLACLIGKGGLAVCLIPISPVLATVTLMFPTPLLCMERSGDDGPEKRGRPRGSAWLGRDQVWTGRNAHRPFWITLEPLGTPKGIHPVFTSALSNTPQNMIWTSLIMYNTCYHNRAIIRMYVQITIFSFHEETTTVKSKVSANK